MIRSYKYRLLPTTKQVQLLDKHIDACRFVYNLALETKIYAYRSQGKSLGAYDLMKQLADLKKDHSWLRDIDSQALNQSMIHIERAYASFFRTGNGFPTFKNKRTSTKSFANMHKKCIWVIADKVFIPKFREGIRFAQDRVYNGTIKGVTVSKSPTGKYFISIVVDNENIMPKKSQIMKPIGVDLGLAHFIVTSDGVKVDNPRYLRNSLERLKVLQRRLRNKNKGSNNKKKAYRKLSVLHERVANQRKDFLHKLSTNLVNNHDTICLEDLNVKGMIKSHSLALSISDAGWGEFVQQIKYKAEWNGKNALWIPRFEPSTKVCSSCGTINHHLTLKDREWTCVCGAKHDRDINAAINIKNYCLRNSGEGIPGAPVEQPTLVGAMKQEKLNVYTKRQ